MRVTRQARALVVASGLHALAMAALRLVPDPMPLRVASHAPIELDTIAIQPRPPTPPPPLEPPRPTAHTHTRPLRRAAIAPTPAAPSASPPSIEPRANASRGPVELFPRGVLDAIAGPPPRGDDDAHRARTHDDRGAHPDDTPGGWLDDAAAEARTHNGAVAPEWRAIERSLAQRFAPPPSAVHDEPPTRARRIADRFKTYVQQMIATVAHGEDGLRRHPNVPGSHAIAIGASGFADPGNQGFQGVPEGLNFRSMPLDQQQAVLAATGDPARWLTVEIEVTVDADGKIAARVAFPSGRRALDRYALAAVQEEVARNPVPATISRWACKAGYAVSQPTSVALTFDETMLFDKSMRKRLAVQYPMQERVDVNVALKWVKPLR